MRKPLNLTIWLLILLASLQIAFIGLLVDDKRGAAISTNSLMTLGTRNVVSDGNKLPPFIYDTSLGAHLSGGFTGQSATLIFGGCKCQTERMKSLADAAVKRSERVMFFIQDPPQYIDAFREHYHISEPVYAIRVADEYSAFNTTEFPLVVHLASDGTIIGTEH